MSDRLRDAVTGVREAAEAGVATAQDGDIAGTLPRPRDAEDDLRAAIQQAKARSAETFVIARALELSDDEIKRALTERFGVTEEDAVQLLVLASDIRQDTASGCARAEPPTATQPRPAAPPRRGAAPATASASEPIELVLSRLERVKKSGDGWTARCPSHEDRNPSLSIHVGDDGRVLLKCHAGCKVDAIVAALGLEMADLFEAGQPQPLARRAKPKPVTASASEQDAARFAAALLADEKTLARLKELRGWTREAIEALGIGWSSKEQRVVIPVRNAEGQLVDLLRYSPTGAQPKMLASDGASRDLFPAPESLPPDGRLWLLEGEPDVIRAHSLGLAAVGVPGVGGWKPEYAERFRDRDIVVCLDSDEKGRNAAKAAAGDLVGVTAEVRRLDLDRDAADEDGFDLTDFAANAETAGEREEMRRILERAANLAATLGASPPGSAQQATVARLPLVTLSDFVARRDEVARAPLVGTTARALMVFAGLIVVGGVGGSTKTTFTIDGVAHFASATAWHGFKIARALRIAMIDIEGPREPLRQKLERKIDVWPGDPFADNVLILDGDPWGNFSFARDNDRRLLREACADHEIDLVVCNPLGRLGMPGGGTPEEVGIFVAWLRECGLWDDLAFWLIHHFNRGPHRDILLRLSGAWDRDADTIIGLAREGDRKTKLTWGKFRWALDGGPEDDTQILEWDVDNLGFHAIAKTETATASAEEMRGRVHASLTPTWQSTTAIRNAVEGRAVAIDQALRELFEQGLARLSVVRAGNEVETVVPDQWDDWGRLRTTKYWKASTEAENQSSLDLGTTADDQASTTPEEGASRPVVPLPVGGTTDGTTDHRGSPHTDGEPQPTSPAVVGSSLRWANPDAARDVEAET